MNTSRHALDGALLSEMLVCSQFWREFVRNFGYLFAILFEVLGIYSRGIHHFTGWEGMGVEGHQKCEQKYCEEIWRFLSFTIIPPPQTTKSVDGLSALWSERKSLGRNSGSPF